MYLINTDSNLIDANNIAEIAVAILDPGADLPFHWGKGFGVTAEPRSVPNLPPLTDPGPAVIPPTPTIPTGLSLFPGDAQMLLSWNEVPAAVIYDIQYKLRSGVVWDTHTSVGTSTIIEGLINGLEYEFQIRARNLSGHSDWSLSFFSVPALASTITSLLPPRFFLGFTGSRPNGDVFIAVFWAAVLNAVMYKVRFKPTSSSVWDESYAPVSSTVFSLDIFAAGVEYEFQVLSIALNGVESDYSSPSFVILASRQFGGGVGQPLFISVDTIGETFIDLSWASAGDFVRAYEVEITDESNGQIRTETFDANQTSVRIDNLTSGVEYSFRARYITNTNLESPYSNIVMATPLDLPDIPGGITGSVAGAVASISWNAVADAERYEYVIVYRLPFGTMEDQVRTGTTTSTSATETVSLPGQTAELRLVQVRACIGARCSLYGVYQPPGIVGAVTQPESIYIRAATTPSTPTGGMSDANHLPAGWSRIEPAPTSTEGVYSSSRTLTFRNGAFDAATAWGAPVLHSAPVPSVPTIPDGITGSVNNAGTISISWNASTGVVDRYEYIITYTLGVLGLQSRTGTATSLSASEVLGTSLGLPVLVSVRVRACNQGGCSNYGIYNAPDPGGDTITTRGDTVYRLSAGTPSTPSGGTNEQNHTPAGWARVEPSPTTTQGVYSSSRTLTFRNGAFDAATAWGAPSRTAPPIIQPSVPASPGNQNAVVRTGRIDMSWDASPGAARYEWSLQYSPGLGVVTESGSTTETSASLINGNIRTGTGRVISFSVRACNAEGCST